MGSVSPLIATWQELKEKDDQIEFLFVGTKNGPEQKAVVDYKIPFVAIHSGKLRRYFDWQNFSDPIEIVIGFFESLKIISKFRPDAIMIAGSFVGVPVAWAGWLLKVPVLVHQQDIEVGLANRLMSWPAKKITVSFSDSLKHFKSDKVILTGNAVRKEFLKCDKSKSRKFFSLKDDLPTILITGGGTGAKNLNKITREALPKLMNVCQVIHSTGKDKSIDFQSDNYHQYEFLTNEMSDAVCAADIVVSRAGLSMLSELTIAAKPTVLIPMYQTHQEFNADFYKKHEAAIVLSENGINGEMFFSVLADLAFHKDKLEKLSGNISKMMPVGGAQKIAEIIMKF